MAQQLMRALFLTPILLATALRPPAHRCASLQHHTASNIYLCQFEHTETFEHKGSASDAPPDDLNMDSFLFFGMGLDVPSEARTVYMLLTYRTSFC